MTRFGLHGVSLGLLALLAAGPASAGERTAFETVKGWEVEREVGDTSANACIMSHAYQDKDDDNAENAIVFGLNGTNVILVLAYQNWEWDKDEKVKVPFLLGKKVIQAKSNWVGEGKHLKAIFPDTIVPDLLAAKEIVLKFEDSAADFQIPDFAAGYEALRRCDIAASRAPAAAAPAKPAEARIAAYSLGKILQQVVKECEVPTTAKQRNGLDEKMAGMKSEMAALDATISEQIDKRPQPHCPPSGDEPKFLTTLSDFNEMSAEDFIAAVQKRGADEQAKGSAESQK